MPKYQIEIANRQNRVPCKEDDLRDVLTHVLDEEAGPEDVSLSLAVVGEDETREVNRSFLGREGTTDVISFPYHTDENGIDGEIIVNAAEAERQAQGLEHSPWDEVLLYVVHGALHLLGYEDSTPELRQRMNHRAAELLRETGRTLDSSTLLEEQ